MLRKVCLIAYVLFPLLVSIAFGQTGTIKGKIEDTEYGNEPIPGVTVSLLHVRGGTSSLSDGSYVLGNIPVGPDTLRISSVGYKTEYIPVSVFSDSIIEANAQLYLARGFFELDTYERRQPRATSPGHSTIEGRITFPNGTAHSDSYVHLTKFWIDSVGSGYRASVGYEELNPAGDYILHDVWPGQYEIYSMCTGCSYEPRKISVLPDTTLTIDLTLRKSDTAASETSLHKTVVSSRVWDRDRRRPLAGAEVSIFEPGGQMVTTDSNGVFAIESISGGNHFMKFSRSDFHPIIIPVSVTSDKTNRISEIILCREQHPKQAKP